MQVGEPLQLTKKLTSIAATPQMADLRKLLRNLDAVLQLAANLKQQELAESMEDMLSFLHSWFDFQEQSQIGILIPGNADLDALKDQYSALPRLLRSVAVHIKHLTCRSAEGLGRPDKTCGADAGC